MTKYQENFIYITSFMKNLLKIKMVTLLLYFIQFCHVNL